MRTGRKINERPGKGGEGSKEGKKRGEGEREGGRGVRER